MELGHSVGTHEPDEALLGIAAFERSDRVDRIAGPGASLEVADPDAGTARHGSCRCEARLERCHVLCALLERIARRDQPPYFVEPERTHGCKADVPVPAMR